MGKPLHITTIAVAMIIATIIQTQMARAASDIASDIECQRKSHSHIGFVTPQAFDAWFPRTIYFYRKSAQSIERGRLKFGRESGYEIDSGQRYWLASRITWEMLPDGRLFGFIEQKSGYVHVDAVRYICDSTVDEILASR